MFALTLKQSGFTDNPSGPFADSFEPYLTGSEMERPQPQARQVLIKLHLANVNPSDIHFIKGEYGIPRVAGQPAGFEGCGEVVEAGADAQQLIGQRVSFVVAKGGTGAWAEYVLTDASSCVPVPPGLKDEDAAALFVNPLSAIGMIQLAEKAACRGIVLSAAASQLGKLMIGLAKDRAIQTVAMVRRESHLAKLKALGATYALDTSAGDFQQALATAIESTAPTMFLDAVADNDSARVFFGMPPHSRWVVYGKLTNGVPQLDQAGQLIFMNKRIEGFWLTHWLGAVGDAGKKAAFKEAFTRFMSGSWTTEVRRRIPLREAFEELPAELTKPNTGKVMLTP